LLALALALCAATAPTVATAHGQGGGPAPAPLGAPSTPAEQAFVAFESKKRDAAVSRVVAAPLAKARSALERSRGARAAGDTPHSRMLDALALQWIARARDLERATAVEAVLATNASRARDSATKAERARALLAETQSRKERTAAELQRAEADAASSAAKARDAEGARIDASKKAAKGGRVAAPDGAAKKPKGDGGKAPNGGKAPKKK
jgi:hypothetical protein